MADPQSTSSTLSLSEGATRAMREVLDGHKSKWSRLASFAGPAVVVSVAYIDPGNFATNIQAGARYGYSLLWVVLLANVIAMMFQAMSAKLGIVTGRNLAELSRDHFPKPLVYTLWIVSEVAAMATDLAEFLGGAIGLSLLLHIPLLVGMAVTAVVTFMLLHFARAGFRAIELVIAGLVAIIGLSYIAELFIVPVNWPGVGLHLLKPELPDSQAVAIAVGIIGATVMPHALFLHSGLTQKRILPRSDCERKRLIRYSNREVIVALAGAGLINVAMVVMAAGAFHAGHPNVAEIETSYRTLIPLLGMAAAGLFLVSLMASGIASSVVGTMAGQMIMQGFVGFRIPMWARRAVTIIPSFVVVMLGVNTTQALVTSQVVLSAVLPFPMLAIVWFTSREHVMGTYRNSRIKSIALATAACLVIGLNVILLLQTFAISMPFSG